MRHPVLDHRIILYLHLQVLGLERLVVPLALHLAHAANLLGCRGQGTSSTAKRARVDRDLMDTLNRMSESTATIEKMRIEAVLSMHKDNLLDRQENRRIELEMFKIQQAGNEKLAALFADVVTRQATKPSPDVE